MKNFDEEPDRGRDSGSDVPHDVEIVGNSATFKKLREGLGTSIAGDAAGITERFRAAGVYAPSTAVATRAIAESVKQLEVSQATAMKDVIMKSLRAADMPRIDVGEQLTALTRGKPLELPKPVRPVADVRLEQLVTAVNRLIEVAEKQNAALLALDDAMEARHAETEVHADARAARADNRAAWGVTFAGLAAFGFVIEFFFR